MWTILYPQGYTPNMDLDPTEMTAVINRIKRAQGQLGGVVRMLEEGRSCDEVVTQLAAVAKAIDRAGFAVIATGLQHCLADGEGLDGVDVKRMERLFLSLAEHRSPARSPAGVKKRKRLQAPGGTRR